MLNFTKIPQSKQPLPEHAVKVFSGVIFDVYQWDQEQYDGSLKTFEKLKRPDTVLIIPITEDGKIILVDEEQPGKAPFIGFAGGRVEHDEDPLLAAARELHEETGYEAESLTLIDAVQPISKIEWTIYTYVARGCKKVAEQHLDSGEKVDLKLLSFDEMVSLMARDDFPDKESNLVRIALRSEYDSSIKEEFRKLLFG